MTALSPRPRRDVVHYHRGAAVVPVAGRAPAIQHLPGHELWEGPRDVLRARLRDQARDGRVEPEGWEIPTRGLPRGWVRMRVDLKPPPPVYRRRWFKASAVAAGVAGILAGGWMLLSWVLGTLAALAAGATAGGLTAAGVVVALLLLAGGGTTVVVTTVTVRRWF